jgi:hypothetical protein
MISNNGRVKLSEKGLLTPDNCVVALIDHQPQMLFGVSNFDSTWTEAHHIGDTRRCIIDLIEVTSIDRNGEAVLAEMMSQGAEFIASDVYTKHFLGNLRSELKRNRMKGKQDGRGND